MVKQGDIIVVDFDPQKGHEQKGRRPAVVISNNKFHKYTNLAILCPITNTDRPFPLHISLDNRTKTTGIVMCEQIKTVDINTRKYRKIEKIPEDLLFEIIDTVFSEIENN